jgi:hypothetical protein
MKAMHRYNPILLLAVLSVVGCDQGVQLPLPVSPSQVMHPTPPPTSPAATPFIDAAAVHPGAPDTIDENCFFVCPPDVVLRPDPDGGYTLEPGTQYSIWFSIEFSPQEVARTARAAAGCLSSAQASYSWDEGSDRHTYNCTHGPYVATEAVFGFVTPPLASLSSLALNQRITLVAETNSATAKKDIPIRFAR